MFQIGPVWCLLGVLTAACAVEYSHTIYVDPRSGTNSPACLNSSTPSLPCRNLSYAFLQRNSSTQYVLQSGIHYLNSVASDKPFTELQDIAIVGNDSVGAVSIVCFTTNAGIAFIDVQNIVFGNVRFFNCCSQQNSTSKNFTSFSAFELLFTRVALYFSHCESITMQNVTVADSPGAAGITIYNTIGTNTFTNCYFKNNKNGSYPGGGGVYVEFSYCLPGDISCENGTEISHTDYNQESTYTFTRCEFDNNEASTIGTNKGLFIVPYRQNHMAFGRGGGLSIFFKANASNNTIEIIDCKFTSNRAEWGAGLFVEFHDSSLGNTVLISGQDCNFINNSCTGVGGGGMRLGHYVYEDPEPDPQCSMKGNVVNIINGCIFVSNEAPDGGGLSVSPARQVAQYCHLFDLYISEVTFDSNRGKYGAALKIDLFNLVVSGRKPHITITNCWFSKNTVQPPFYKGPHEVGIGAVYINEVNVKFREFEGFNWNNGSALAVVGATVDFMESSISFLGNEGVNGGAIALLGSARILINENTLVNFRYNTASVHGGAIYNKYTDKNNYRRITNCFVAHNNSLLGPNDWKARFDFSNNFDSGGTMENAIYSTSILPCDIAGGNGTELVTKIFCWENWIYNDGDNCTRYIQTGPGHIIIEDTESSVVKGLEDSSITNATIVHAYPGKIIHLPIYALDDLNHPLQVVYTATVYGYGINHTNNTSGTMIDQNYAYVSNNNIRILGDSGSSIIVDLNSVGDRYWHVRVLVNLTDCPPGLTPTPINCNTTADSVSDEEQCNDDTYACECIHQKSFVKYVQCNTPTNASLGSGYWMGEWKQGGKMWYVTADCPAGFCRTNTAEFIPLPLSDLNQHVCGTQNRRGIVCGECIKDYGPALNSKTYECVQCNLTRGQLARNTTYYILSVYVPLFLMFLALILFNIKLTTGPANAFILYSQVISSTFGIDAGGAIPLKAVIPHIHSYLKAYNFPYGIFNLRFFEHFVPTKYLCLGTHLNALDILRLDYFVASFPLLMIIAIVALYKVLDYCTKCRTCLQKIVRVFSSKSDTARERVANAIIPAFASFILLSYTKFSLTSSYIISYVELHNASGHQEGPFRAFFAAHYAYNSTEYILYYMLPAIIVFLTFVAIPPLVLLDYPLRLFELALRQFPWLWHRYPYDKIHIILDAFQSCYKKKWRCFAGLYFVFRLLINITNALCGYLQQFFLQEIYCIVFALLIAFLKPYKKEYHLLNYIDSFMFFNLALINLITLYLYANTREGSNPTVLVFTIQYILVFIPLIYMLSYVVWSLLPIPNVRAKIKMWLVKREASRQLENLIQNDALVTREPTDDIDWERAEAINHYSPIQSPVSHRDSIPLPNEEPSEQNANDSGLSVHRQTYGSTATGGSTSVSFDTSIPENDN